jgi:hypothetical protein
VIVQIRDALQVTLDALATGIQMGPLGFEVVQRYPVRVLREAITNAVIHRDYRLPTDIHIRIFASRIEVESPGLLPGHVTVANIGTAGSRPRNRALVDHLREFPTPPNLDAGEGVRMIMETMDKANLYPPLFVTKPDFPREAVLLALFNVARRSVVRSVDVLQVLTSFEIGRCIVEDEQRGSARAGYGKQVLKELAERLTAEFGRGFSRANLQNMRSFFLLYRDRLPRIRQTPSGKSPAVKPSGHPPLTQSDLPFRLSWSQYVFLVGIRDAQERAFYEIESAKNDWENQRPFSYVIETQ